MQETKSSILDDVKVVPAVTSLDDWILLSQDKTRRNLKGRHIQVMSIGGVIGTVLFVQIGSALAKGGPASLFIAFLLWSTVMLAFNNCVAEMVTWMPVSSPFIRYAQHFVDPAFGFCLGVLYFLSAAVLVPFEITALNLTLKFWTDKIPILAVIFLVLTSYILLNVVGVKWFGEAEFWLSLGKIFLIIGLIIFTVVTMSGGNPLHDAYGFRNWDPSAVKGAPFAEYLLSGPNGRVFGFLAALCQAAATMGGPDFIAMTAGEARNPRRTLPRAFQSVYIRLSTFFLLGSLCVGIIIPYNDPDLLSAMFEGRPGAGSSPYVIAMSHLRIPILPHIVNALIITSIFSAGNVCVYMASRSLYGLALEGMAPRVLKTCSKNGVPLYCVAVVAGIGLLSLLQVSNSSAVVLQWLMYLLTGAFLLDYTLTSFTYIRFFHALKAQGIQRDSLPHKSFWQPFCGYYAFTCMVFMICINGFVVFVPGQWNTTSFIFSYGAVFLAPVLFIGYKIARRTKAPRMVDLDFMKDERALVDEYERALAEIRNRNCPP